MTRRLAETRVRVPGNTARPSSQYCNNVLKNVKIPIKNKHIYIYSMYSICMLQQIKRKSQIICNPSRVQIMKFRMVESYAWTSSWHIPIAEKVIEIITNICYNVQSTVQFNFAFRICHLNHHVGHIYNPCAACCVILNVLYTLYSLTYNLKLIFNNPSCV